MISKNIKQFCKEYEKIENYEAAVNSDELWDCHHRLETDENKTAQQLMEEGLYWDRPADELIFLTKSEHIRLHKTGENNPMYGKENKWGYHTEETKKKMSEAKKGKVFTEETRKKMSESMKGKNKGKHHTEETKKKMSEAQKGEKNPNFGKHHTEETRKKMSENNPGTRGKHWHLENGKRVYTAA